MTTVTLTKCGYQDLPLVVLTYQFEEELLIRGVLEHPDFHVPEQYNIDLVFFEHETHGWPVEIVRQREDGHVYNVRIGYIDHDPSNLNL